jgi:hypothetical protein
MCGGNGDVTLTKFVMTSFNLFISEHTIMIDADLHPILVFVSTIILKINTYIFIVAIDIFFGWHPFASEKFSQVFLFNVHSSRLTTILVHSDFKFICELKLTYLIWSALADHQIN